MNHPDHDPRGTTNDLGRKSKPREMPQNSEIEQGLLGALMIDNRLFDKIPERLAAEHFFAPVHGKIFTAIRDLVRAGKPATPVALKPVFASNSDLSHLGGAAYLGDLVASVVTLMSAPDYAEQIIELATRREMIAALEQAQADLYNPPNVETSSRTVAEQLERSLYACVTDAEDGGGIRHMSAHTTKAIGLIETAYKTPAGLIIGLTTGIRKLDEQIRGFRPGQYITIGARPGMGKSAIGQDIRRANSQAGKVVLTFQLEMPGEDMAMRDIAHRSNLPVNTLIGEMTRAEFEQALHASMVVGRMVSPIDDTPRLTVAKMQARAVRYMRQGKLDGVIVDHIGLVEPENPRTDVRHQIAQITRDLKIMAKTLGVPVIGLSQLNRLLTARDDKRPTLSDLRESGAIEENSDIVIFLHREHYYASQKPPKRETGISENQYQITYTDWVADTDTIKNDAELIVAKLRQGKTGVIRAHWSPEQMSFSDR